MMDTTSLMTFNKYQSSVEDLNLEDYPDEVKEQFWDFIDNVPYIKYMVGERPRACDLGRDDKGRIVVDITKPHILENMEYFMPSALHYRKYGTYTKLRPNKNPNSEFGKWFRTELIRCLEGYVRESDGEWVTGNMYFFMNYCPIPLTKITGKSKKGERIIDFPEMWEGIYYRYHYIEQAQHGGIFNPSGGNNGCEISSRGKSKSLSMAAIMAKYFTIGESRRVRKAVKCLATAYQKQYLTSDGILNKFQSYIDFHAQNTQFSSRRLKSSLQDMAWKAGYLDLNTRTQMGTLNEVLGVSAKDDPSKVRGKRMNFIIVEEFGSFRNVLELYNIMLPSVQEGDISFGTMYLIGTAGDDESDFQGAAEIVYNPKGYRMYALPNVFDKTGQGRPYITFFFPGYINRKGCYDKDGNSDVTKALLEILSDRYRIKYNSSDVNSIAKAIAEIPITPQEAILRTRGNIFPVSQLNDRINQIDSNPNFYDDTYVGDLFINSKNGEIEFKPTTERPIREFPLKDNLAKGAIEIFNMPEKDSSGKVFSERYILGHDPVDNDMAESMSLTSTFVLDLWTDRIVAEYTGRQDFAEDNYEIVRKLCLFYNGRCCYESNKKGTFAYFSKMNSVHLLADTPEYLRDKQLIKYSGFGSGAKGINASLAINNYANGLIRDWLLKPITTTIQEGGEDKDVVMPNIAFVKNRALLKELVLFNPDINVDRIRALGMVMLYREEYMIKYQGQLSAEAREKRNKKYVDNDDFFTRNYKV